MSIIPKLAEATGKRAEFIEALKVVVRNDVRIVKSKLIDLPAGSVEEVGE